MSVPIARAIARRWRPTLTNPVRLLVSAKPWLALGFLLLGFPIGVFWFVVLVTLIALGLGLAITWVGIPILATAMVLWIVGARLERWRIARFFGEVIPSPYRPRPAGGIIARARVRTRDPAVWRDLAYLLLLFPIGVTEFVIAAVALWVPLSLILLPTYYWLGEGPEFAPGVRVDTLPEALLGALVGMAVVVPAGLILIGTARAHLALARWLLGPSRGERLQERVDVLTRSRSGAMEAMLLERRRIERDLHDGAQQQILALLAQVELTRAEIGGRDADVDRGLRGIGDGLRQVHRDLRELARGVHPAVLTDHGLPEAVRSALGRLPMPTDLSVSAQVEGSRYPPTVEAAAYFLVLEALANTMKHTGTGRASVSIAERDGVLEVTVRDDGPGFDPSAVGSGLVGLSDRLAAAGGRLEVDSRPGAGTTLRGFLPVDGHAGG